LHEQGGEAIEENAGFCIGEIVEIPSHRSGYEPGCADCANHRAQVILVQGHSVQVHCDVCGQSPLIHEDQIKPWKGE